MRLVYVTVSMPFGVGEEFVIAEVKEWLRRGHEVLIIPRSARGKRVVNQDARCLQQATVGIALWSPRLIATAICEALQHPMRLLKALRVVCGSRNTAILWKNLVVLPKAIWLARLVKRRHVDHIHVHWATTTATMGLIASEWSDIPWSLTAHRGDVVENNLLVQKTRKASFARYISDKTRTMAEEMGADAYPDGRSSSTWVSFYHP
jgi:hypothetical protein